MITRRDFLEASAQILAAVTVVASTPGRVFSYIQGKVAEQGPPTGPYETTFTLDTKAMRISNRRHWVDFCSAYRTKIKKPDTRGVAMSFQRAMEKHGATEMRDMQYEYYWDIRGYYMHIWRAQLLCPINK